MFRAPTGLNWQLPQTLRSIAANGIIGPPFVPPSQNDKYDSNPVVAAAEASVERRYDYLRWNAFVYLIIITIGVIGIFIGDVSERGAIGTAGILFFVLGFYGGFLFSTKLDFKVGVDARNISIRIVILVLAWLVAGVFLFFQIRQVVNCNDPAVLAGDPVLNYICTNSYAIIIMGVVYGGLWILFIPIIFGFELALFYAIAYLALMRNPQSAQYLSAVMKV